MQWSSSLKGYISECLHTWSLLLLRQLKKWKEKGENEHSFLPRHFSIFFFLYHYVLLGILFWQDNATHDTIITPAAPFVQHTYHHHQSYGLVISIITCKKGDNEEEKWKMEDFGGLSYRACALSFYSCLCHAFLFLLKNCRDYRHYWYWNYYGSLVSRGNNKSKQAAGTPYIPDTCILLSLLMCIWAVDVSIVTCGRTGQVKNFHFFQYVEKLLALAWLVSLQNVMLRRVK